MDKNCVYIKTLPNQYVKIHNPSYQLKSHAIFASNPEIIHDIDVYFNDGVVNATSLSFLFLSSRFKISDIITTLAIMNADCNIQLHPGVRVYSDITVAVKFLLSKNWFEETEI